MGKIIRLTERDLTRLVKRVITEMQDPLDEIKNKLMGMGIDTSEMDEKEVLYQLTDAIESTNNERLKHELKKLYYGFWSHHGHGDPGDPSTMRRPKPNKEKAYNPNFKFDYEDEDSEDDFDFLSDMGIKRP
jgi:hypothetical protein